MKHKMNYGVGYGITEYCAMGHLRVAMGESSHMTYGNKWWGYNRNEMGDEVHRDVVNHYDLFAGSLNRDGSLRTQQELRNWAAMLIHAARKQFNELKWRRLIAEVDPTPATEAIKVPA